MENDKEERKWKVLRSEYLFRRPWLTVRRERIGLPGGGEIPEYYVLEYPDWVNTIARTCTGEFVFVRQYRRGLDRTCFELCAGVRDPQDATPEAAARRELLEETGFGGGQWSELMVVSANPSTQTNLTHCFGTAPRIDGRPDSPSADAGTSARPAARRQDQASASRRAPVALLRRESPAVKAGQRHRFRHADDRDGRHDDRYRPARNGRLAATGISAKPVLHTDKPSGKEY